MLIPLEPHRQPAHDPAADLVAERMFLMHIVQGVEGGDGNLGVAQVACRGLLLRDASAAPPRVTQPNPNRSTVNPS
jgi:hypothetical protein